MSQGGRSCTVFIGNVPYDATEEELRGIFGRVGPVDSLRLVYDKDTKQPKGYGFCDYANADTALSAIRTLNDVECSGRRLRIDLADNALRGRELAHKASLGPSQPLSLPAPDPQARPALPPSSAPAVPPALPVPTSLPPGVAPLRSGQTPGVPADSSQPSPEAVIAAVSAHTEIAQTVAAMPQAQLQICLGAMQRLATEAPENARALLQENPQLCYALLHAQLLLGLALDPMLPPAPEEMQNLRMAAARRPAPAVAMPFVGVPGVMPQAGFPGGGPVRPVLVPGTVGTIGINVRTGPARFPSTPSFAGSVQPTSLGSVPRPTSAG